MNETPNISPSSAENSSGKDLYGKLRTNKHLAWVVIIILLAVGAFIAYQKFDGFGNGLVKIDPNASLVPLGFPSDIPLEEKNIISSGSNSDEAGTHLKAKYRTEASLAEKYDEYVSALRESGYVINPGKQELAKNLILASKNHEIVSIAFYTNDQTNIVDINYSNLRIVDEGGI